MAFIPQLLTDEEQKRQDQIRAASGMPDAGGASMPAGAQPSPTSGASGNYTNLQRYLDENKSQAGDLAGKVAGTVTAAGEEAKTAAEGLAAAGKSQVEAARVQPSGIVNEAATNPTGVDADAAKKAAFQKERDASYTGPSSLEDVQGFQDAQDKVKKAQERIGLTETEPGRTTLLKEMGGPGYGQGKADLNQLLLSGDPNAAGILSSAVQPYKNLQDFLGAQNDETRTAATKAADEAAATKQAVQDRFAGPGGVFEQTTADLMAKLAAAKTGGGAEAQAAADALAKWEPTDQDLATLGMTRADYNGLKGYRDITSGQAAIDPKAYLTTRAPDAEFSLANVSSADDYAREAALEDLMGTSLNTLNPEDAALAGTAPKSLIDYDLSGASAASKSALKSYMDKPLESVKKALAINPANAFNPDIQPYAGLTGARSMSQMASGDFYNALKNMGMLYSAYDQVNHVLEGITPSTPGYIVDKLKALIPEWQKVREALAPTIESPLFQQLYAAAKQARSQQTPGTPPDALYNHISPELRAMLS